MDANAKAITRAKQIAKDYIDRVGDWYDEKAISRAIEYMEEIYKLPDDLPRNCDRFADELDAQLAFLNEVWLISIDRETMTEQDTYEKWTDEMKTRYGRWLLAPATEKEGGAK